MPDSVYADLRTQHWTEEKKSFPDSSCSIMNPPPGKADAPIMSACIAESKGLVVSYTYLSPKQKLSMAEYQGDHGQGDRPYALNRPY